MRGRKLFNLIVVIAVTLISLLIVLPFQKPEFMKSLLFWQDPRIRDFSLKQGLDLKGGLQVLMTADVKPGTLITGTLDSARSIIENRVNGTGVAEPVVQMQGGDRILVELPGVTDRQLAIDLVKRTGSLEFVDAGVPLLAGTPITTSFALAQALIYPQTAAVGKPISSVTPISGTTIYPTAFTGEILESTAAPQSTTTGSFDVRFAIKGNAQAAFAEFTGSRINKPLCIVLDGVVLSCPTIQARLTDGGVITGRFTSDEARQLAVTLNYGALPVPLKIEAVREVGATLGADAVRKSVVAGIIGFIVLAIFLLLNYKLPGIVGVIALGLFVLFSLAVFILMPVVLTLPGIAGFIISIAAAVDANILVFERFREELRAGRSLRGAVEAGFQRAWPSIRDSNLSTLIICAILYSFGSAFGASAVRGFAINLVIGLVVSLFSAMFVTRTLMRLVFGSDSAASLNERKDLLGI